MVCHVSTYRKSFDKGMCRFFNRRLTRTEQCHLNEQLIAATVIIGLRLNECCATPFSQKRLQAAKVAKRVGTPTF